MKFSANGLLDKIRRARLKALKNRLNFELQRLALRAEVQKETHSLLWVWEFSKKAVLICFIFYILVQVYSMCVMIWTYDFTHLGVLIEQTGQITQNCVFAYLIKAGLENIGKIWFSHIYKAKSYDDDEDDGPVG